MNKNTFLIAIALASGLVWMGCNKAGKLNQPSTFTPPSGPVELKVKWPIGERVVHDIAMKMNSEITVPNQPKPMQQDINMGEKYAVSVLHETPDGGHELELEFLAMRMTMMMG
ncbi:MAG TPA: hypothetical protein VL970_08335, partial [Candidatus Acidoferrales bacterium]|nr:hypothetical protein [Candidatus Acidoferrales bacterium]